LQPISSLDKPLHEIVQKPYHVEERFLGAEELGQEEANTNWVESEDERVTIRDGGTGAVKDGEMRVEMDGALRLYE
jgi:hypothetical protein